MQISCVVLGLTLSAMFSFVRSETPAYGELHLPGEITGSFRLEKRVFCVGEPIMVEFLVRNASERPYTFYVGSDYHGRKPRHGRFSFRVKNDAGRDFTDEPINNAGGMGTTITVEPRKQYASWQLLNPWAHLMPPGHYHVDCWTRLADDFPLPQSKVSRPRDNPIEITQGLEFDITTYHRAQIVAAIHQLKSEARTWGSVTPNTQTGRKPFDWALEDLAEKFQTGIARNLDDAKFEDAVVAALPREWNDRYFLEYDLWPNRNWVSAVSPEDVWLTFSVRNNSNQAITMGLMESSLSVNGRRSEAWSSMLGGAITTRHITNSIGPGEIIEVRIHGNDFLTEERICNICWAVDGFSKGLQIRVEDRR